MSSGFLWWREGCDLLEGMKRALIVSGWCARIWDGIRGGSSELVERSKQVLFGGRSIRYNGHWWPLR